MASMWVALFAAIASGCSSSDDLGGDDQNGIKGGTYAFDVRVSDDGFTPSIIKTENDADVTVNLQNVGTRPHGFHVEGFVATSAAPSADIAPIAAGASASVTFHTPFKETIYAMTSPAPDDHFSGQFVLQ